ncbi:MAG: DinB family protein [Phycisphaerales bacterium JB061]
MQADLVMREPGPSFDELAELPTSELIDRYGIGVERIDPRAFELDDDLLDTAFLESAGVGKWPVRVLIGHLADCEILNANRLRRTVAEDGPMLHGFDPDPYIDNGLYKLKPKDAPGDSARAACGAFVATIHTIRAWTRDWLMTLDDAAWDRKALHVTRGEFTTKRLLGLATWHIEHHASFLPRKIDLLLGNTGPGSA